MVESWIRPFTRRTSWHKTCMHVGLCNILPFLGNPFPFCYSLMKVAPCVFEWHYKFWQFVTHIEDIFGRVVVIINKTWIGVRCFRCNYGASSIGRTAHYPMQLHCRPINLLFVKSAVAIQVLYFAASQFLQSVRCIFGFFCLKYTSDWLGMNKDTKTQGRSH